MSTARNAEVMLLATLARIPLLSHYRSTRGWSFVLSWTNRIFALALVAYLFAHLYTLSSLADPPRFTALMATYNNALFTFLEWLLAFPLLFHALNGARLILYESFGQRNNQHMIRWSFYLILIYMSLLAFSVLLGDQAVSPLFFWLNALLAGMVSSFYLYRRIWSTPNPSLWKLQRISAAFLFVMLPAHMIFTHLSYSVGHEASTIIQRIREPYIRAVDLALLLTVLFHAGFGIFTVVQDYVATNTLRRVLTLSTVLAMLYFCYVGVRLTLFA